MPSTRRINRSSRSSSSSGNGSSVSSASPPVISSFANEPCGHKYAPLNSSASSTSSSTLPEQVAAPKHFPFPNTAVATDQDDFFFEFVMTWYCVTAMAVQFVHMYRTVWWLPHSHNKLFVNMYLIDDNLTIFLLLILSRRLFYLTGCKVLDKIFGETKSRSKYYFYYKYFLFVGVFSWLSLCAYRVMHNHQIEKILYLCYPFVIYLIFFGFKISPFFELTGWVSVSCSSPPLHACTSVPAEIRAEVGRLIKNFNYRMKEILFSTILNAYYAGFIPCCFAQPAVYYDTFWAAQHIFFIFLSSFLAFFIHIISLRYCDILHRSCLHLGIWEKVETGRTMLLVNSVWKDDVLWPYGSLVKFGRDVWKAQGDCNAGEPVHPGCRRFYFIFKNPAHNLGMLLVIQMCVIIYQIILLIKSSLWHNILSITVMLLFNYYVLYRLFRDYLISHKIYSEEREMHKKINMR